MRAAATAVVLLCLVLVPAAAGTSIRRPPIALTASPSHVLLEGSSRATIHVTNFGARRVVVDVSRAGFALDVRGRPRIPLRAEPRAAVSWLAVRPRTLALAPGQTKAFTVSSRLPTRAEPGDHDALVLLVTRPRPRTVVAVRIRMGIVVVVRAPGKVVRRLALRSLRVRRMANRSLALELLVLNRGNVTELLDGARVDASLRRRGPSVARLRPEPREVRPGTSGLLVLTYRGPLRGRVTVRVRITVGRGRAVARVYRLRL